METIVLILPRLNIKVNVQKIKENIHKYVGDRMVKEEPAEMPGLVLKGQLEEEDKKAINEISEDCGFIFVEYDEDNEPDGDYLTVEL